MLPGFRFLFAAIVLSMSVLIFGLGAAALLRAAHEEFASIPSRRALPEPYSPSRARRRRRRWPCCASSRRAARRRPTVRRRPLLVDEPAPDAVPVPKVETEKLAALNADDSAACRSRQSRRLPATEPRGASWRRHGRPDTSRNENCRDRARRQRRRLQRVRSRRTNRHARDDGRQRQRQQRQAGTKIATLGSPAATSRRRQRKQKSECETRPQRDQEEAAGGTRARASTACRAPRAIGSAAGRHSARSRRPATADPFGEAATQTQPATAAPALNVYAGPVAIGGPSATPHSVHEPS